MAYLDTDFVDAAIGAEVRCKVAPTAAVFNHFERMARTKVKVAAKMAGYTLGDTDTGDNEQLRDLALGQWVLLAYGARKGIEVPPAIADQIHLLEMVRSGDAPLLDYSPSTTYGVGGVRAASTDQTSGRPLRLSRSELSEW